MATDTVGLVNGRLANNLDGAFPDLVRNLQHGVYSGVLRMVPSAADAEDITQETFIRAYRALSKYEPARIQELNLRGWIWTIALNLCRNAARTRCSGGEAGERFFNHASTSLSFLIPR